jgi:hypothetical protein
MPNTVTLAEATVGDGMDVLLVPASLPFVRGNSPEGETWLCVCGEAVAVGMYSRQFLDIGIVCPLCHRELRTSIRQAGEPVPGTPLLLGPGRYRLDGELDVTGKPVAMAGIRALVGYAKETGRKVPGVFSPTPVWEPSDLNAVTLHRIARELIKLLGQRYQKLQVADLRGRQSASPPRNRQRVIELISFAQETAWVLERPSRAANAALDGDMLSELIGLTAMLHRWRNHPAWAAIVQTLSHETEPLHSLVLLLVASYLVDANNGVGLHLETEGGKVPDMWLRPSLIETLNVEVKTPLQLRSPVVPLTAQASELCITETMKKASKQLRGDHNLLVIGGFHLGESLDQLELAAQSVLRSNGSRQNYVGILLCDLTFETATNVFRRTTLTYSTTMRTRLASHPRYSGGLSIVRDAAVKRFDLSA